MNYKKLEDKFKAIGYSPDTIERTIRYIKEIEEEDKAGDSVGSVLLEADSIINRRENAHNGYGPIADSFKRHAAIFNLINPNHLTISALDVAYMLKSIKLGREFYNHKRDNLVDDCGYTDIIRQIREAEERDIQISNKFLKVGEEAKYPAEDV